MGPQLEFMDCPTCGKRMVTTAPKCHHCQQRPLTTPSRRARSDAFATETPEDADVHMAASHGGYDREADDFDYDEFVEQEFPDQPAATRKKSWIWITAWVLIVAILFPIIVSFIYAR